MQRLLFFLGFCAFVGASAGATNQPLCRYFDDADALKSAPVNYVLRVESVENGAPAALAGMQNGDLLIGVDAWRVRGMSEYILLRMLDDTRPDISITIAREGVIKTIHIPKTLPVRRLGIEAVPIAPNFQAELEKADVSLSFVARKTPRVAKQDDAMANLMDAFDTTASPSDAGAEYNATLALPARIQESLLSIARNNTPTDCKWTGSFLELFHLLTEEKWGEALQLLKDAKLAEQCKSPFLKDVLAFYGKVAATPPSANATLSATSYGVDVPFFALCYPYPNCGEDSKSFTKDLVFQKYFDQYFSGNPVSQTTLDAAAYQFANKNLPATEGIGGLAERYVLQVKAAILSEQAHGGWPYRSELIYTSESRKQVVAGLKKRLSAQPEDAVITAIAMIAPAVMDANDADFRQAYTIMADAGPREALAACRIMDRTGKHWRRDDLDQLHRTQQDVEKNVTLPEFYRCLSAISHVFHYQIAPAARLVGSLQNSQPAYICRTVPLIVAKALQKTGATEISGYTTAELTKAAPKQFEKALAALTATMIFNPGRDCVEELSASCKAAHAGRVFENLTYALNYRTSLGLADQLTMFDIRKRVFGELEERQYAMVATEISKLDDKDPKLADKLGDYYARFGVPSVCALISAKLRAAGQNAPADEYARKIADFYDVAAAAFAETRVYRHALREFLSTPGFEEWTGKYRRFEKNWTDTDSTFILKALADFYQERTDSMVGNIVLSCKQGLQQDNILYAFNGRLLTSIAQIRAAMLELAINRQALSDTQMEALKTTKAPEIMAILEKIKPIE